MTTLGWMAAALLCQVFDTLMTPFVFLAATSKANGMLQDWGLGRLTVMPGIGWELPSMSE